MIKRRKNQIKRIVALLSVVAGFSLFGFVFVSGDYFDVIKNIEIYAAITKQLEVNYVDKIDHSKLMNKGAQAMLSSLDPYSDFIPEEDLEAYRSSTTGEYGGIGSIIGNKKGVSTVLMPYEGFPAHKSGLQIGDQILEIDGVSTKGLSTSDITDKLRGKPGTQLELLVNQFGVEKKVYLTREKIVISNVPYADVVADDIGYIKLTDFTTDAKNETEKALLSLKRKGVKGVILDLRGNPGGLLDEAIKITNIFLENGSEVVVTKGRDNATLKRYLAPSQALDTEIPLVILINNMSASASEIVSGVIQDHDRGVLVGRKTFGKGLVQSTRPLPYNAQLKLTTAKYYIPSGRCIQAIDYSNRKEDGSVEKIPDSLKLAYKTRGGRTVYDGEGIDPDVEVKSKVYDEMLIHLVNSDIIFDFATEFKKNNKEIESARKFVVSDELFNEFMNFLRANDFNYKSGLEKYIAEINKRIGGDSAMYELDGEFERINDLIEEKKAQALVENSDDIKTVLKEEILSRYYLRRGIVESSFSYDADIMKGIEILHDKKKYESILVP